MKCPRCDGKGYIITTQHSVFDSLTNREILRNGRKKETCYGCEGKGTVPTGGMDNG